MNIIKLFKENKKEYYLFDTASTCCYNNTWEKHMKDILRYNNANIDKNNLILNNFYIKYVNK